MKLCAEELPLRRVCDVIDVKQRNVRGTNRFRDRLEIFLRLRIERLRGSLKEIACIWRLGLMRKLAPFIPDVFAPVLIPVRFNS